MIETLTGDEEVKQTRKLCRRHLSTAPKVKTKPAKRTKREGYSTRVTTRRRKRVAVSNEGEDEQMVEKMVESLYEDLIREFKRNGNCIRFDQ